MRRDWDGNPWPYTTYEQPLSDGTTAKVHYEDANQWLKLLIHEIGRSAWADLKTDVLVLPVDDVIMAMACKESCPGTVRTLGGGECTILDLPVVWQLPDRNGPAMRDYRRALEEWASRYMHRRGVQQQARGGS